MATVKYIAYLIRKEEDGELDEQEKKDLEEWLARSPENREKYDQLKNGWGKLMGLAQNGTDEKWDEFIRVYNELFGVNALKKKKSFFLNAACLLIILAILMADIFLLLKDLPRTDRQEPFLTRKNVAIQLSTDSLITPGTLPILKAEGNYRIFIHNDTMFYMHKAVENGVSGDSAYNHIHTYTGGQYTIQLPDESIVTLNAGSSISFPVDGAIFQRKVKLSGEAYFDIKKDSSGKVKRPFIVEAETRMGLKQQIEVIGTRFNVNAYGDEPVITTSLIEGIVKVTSNGQSAVLESGQQLKVTLDSVLNPGPIRDEVIAAWKENYFLFEKASAQTVVKELIRWYGVKIEIEGNPKDSVVITALRTRPYMEVLDKLAKLIDYKIINDGEQIRLIARQ